MALHMLMSSAPHWPAQLQPLLSPDDILLLAGDGVYLQPFIRHLAQVYVREYDLTQRGISLLPPVQALNDADWVKLTLAHQPVVSWT